MAKQTSERTEKGLRHYTIFHALLVGLVCGAAALGIGFLIAQGKIKHNFDVLFPHAAVGILITILNFKPLSKLAIFLLPPMFALSGFGLVAGALAMSYFGWRSEDVGDGMQLLVENVPFFIVATILYNWYASLAKDKSFLIYATYGIITVVVSMLLFGGKYPEWQVQGAYLGISAFLFSLLHLKRAL